jgi:hypothetical protein
VARLATLVEAGAWTVYAWALLPNHAHLLVRTGGRPLPRSMRSILTGYAGAFNRRHKRVARKANAASLTRVSRSTALRSTCCRLQTIWAQSSAGYVVQVVPGHRVAQEARSC